MDNGLPRHVGIIMDGNRRWAKINGKDPIHGYEVGAQRVTDVIRSAHKIGIKYLTIYAFSLNNWSRTKVEIDYLTSLLERYLHSDHIEEFCMNNIKMKVIGNVNMFPSKIVNRIKELEKRTELSSDLTFQIALSYGSRDEIIRAVRSICDEVLQNKISIGSITEGVFNEYLDTRGSCDLDLIIRTSGEMRLSDFLLWQAAYSELYFTPTMWPEFTEQSFVDAISEYKLRDRRYGKD